jgi:hypothetical protein
MLDIRASAAILMLLSGACAPLQQPDLVRLYAPVAAKPNARAPSRSHPDHRGRSA